MADDVRNHSPGGVRWAVLCGIVYRQQARYDVARRLELHERRHAVAGRKVGAANPLE